jgi:hypothetical protein
VKDLLFIQKSLWLLHRHPERGPEPSEGSAFRFAKSR